MKLQEQVTRTENPKLSTHTLSTLTLALHSAALQCGSMNFAFLRGLPSIGTAANVNLRMPTAPTL